MHILIEVTAQGDGPAINAGLDFAAEEGLACVLPTAVISHHGHRPADGASARVDSELAEQLECGQCSGPGLTLFGASPPIRGKTRASSPLPVVALQCEQSGAPTLSGHSRALRHDDRIWRLHEI